MQLFAHVIAYLRALHYQEPQPQLPKSAADLKLLVCEATFYALPGLAAAAQVCELQGPESLKIHISCTASLCGSPPPACPTCAVCT